MEFKHIQIRRPVKRVRAAAPLGFPVILLSLVGLATVVVLVVNMVSGLYDNTREKDRYKAFLAPVVSLDPEPFDNLSSANNETMLNAAYYMTIINNGKEKYTTDDMGFLIIPDTDFDVSATQLFGTSFKLTHNSFSDIYGNLYPYDSETKSYHCPNISLIAAYEPQIEKVTKSANTITLEVGYVVPGALLTDLVAGSDETDAEKEPEKTMIYSLAVSGDSYTISSITYKEDISLQEPEETDTGGLDTLHAADSLGGSKKVPAILKDGQFIADDSEITEKTPNGDVSSELVLKKSLKSHNILQKQSKT